MDRKIGYLCIFVTTLLFSSVEIVLKLTADMLNPIQMTFGRFFIGGVLLIPLAAMHLARKKIRLKWEDFRWFAVLGFVGVLVSMSFYQFSVTYIEASKVAVLFSSNPLFVTLFAVLLLGEPFQKHKLIAILIDLAGIVLIIQPWHPGLNVTGITFILISTLLFALYGVLGKKESEKLGGIVTTCGSFILGSVEMMVLAALTHIDGVAAFFQVRGMDSFVRIPFLQGCTMENLGYLLYLGFVATGIGYACYFLAMERVQAQEVSIVFFFKPVLAAAGSVIVLGEQIPQPMALGIGLILI